MFLPFGLFISYYLKLDKPHLSVLLTIIASLAIETVQMCIGRVFDVDDILLNVLGGILGYMIYNMLRKIADKFPKLCTNEIFLNIVAIISLVGLFILLI